MLTFTIVEAFGSEIYGCLLVVRYMFIISAQWLSPPTMRAEPNKMFSDIGNVKSNWDCTNSIAGPVWLVWLFTLVGRILAS